MLGGLISPWHLLLNIFSGGSMSGEMHKPTWVYHKKEKAKVVSRAEAQKLYEEGWADSPGAAEKAKKKPKEKVAEKKKESPSPDPTAASSSGAVTEASSSGAVTTSEEKAHGEVPQSMK